MLFTDPVRTPDPAASAARLPRGSGVVYRAFGAADAVEVGLRLRAIARRRRLTLLVGADAGLARAIRADGVHLPERLGHLARRLRAPGFHVTVAAHSERALLRASRAGSEAAFLSPVFDSRSPSAGRAMGPNRFASLCRRASLPVYALGGVGAATARRLLSTRAAGIAAVEALA